MGLKGIFWLKKIIPIYLFILISLMISREKDKMIQDNNKLLDDPNTVLL